MNTVDLHVHLRGVLTPELARAIERLDEVRLLTAGLPTVAHVPPGRVTALARFATLAKAQDVARMPEARRAG